MNPEQQIQQLKDALRELVQLVIESGNVTPETQMILTQAMEHVASRIQELRQQEQIPSSLALPELEKHGPSSNINSFGYDPENQQLLVKFQGDYPQENGTVYSYSGVPQEIFELFKRGAIPARTDGKNKWGKWWRGKTPSLGASMFTLIKNNGYPYQKIS